jgi:hypothetical protein
VKRLFLLAPLAAALACGSNPSIIPSGDFSGPTGLAIAPLPDRDLLFVANQGANELRAIIFCNSPPGVPTTCSPKEDGQLLPGPIRVFAGSILAGERPLRLAGARLEDGTGAAHGAVLVAGSEPALHIVDAANILARFQNKTPTAADPRVPRLTVPLPDAPVDVVATDVSGPSVTAVVATQAPVGGSAALTVLAVSIGSDGLAQAVATQRCSLDFTPIRLALIPGAMLSGAVSGAGRDPNMDDLSNGVPKHVYVADGTPGGTPGGTGDGAVEVTVAAIPLLPPGAPPSFNPGPCPTTRRLPASDPGDLPRRARPLRSLAFSPAFIDTSKTRTPAGRFMLGVTAPDAALCADRGTHTCDPSLGVDAGTVCAEHGVQNCGAGRIVILSNDPVAGQSALLTAPATDKAAKPMVPLRPPAPAREVAFLGRDVCPDSDGLQGHTAPCTALRIGAGTVTNPVVTTRQTIGLASTEDGSTVFIDVLNRRFFNDVRDTSATPLPPVPSFTFPAFAPQPAPGEVPPQFTPPNAEPVTKTVGTDEVVVPSSKGVLGWVNSGVTRNAHWRAVWHTTMPGLESLSGNLSRSGSGPIQLTVPAGKDLTRWSNSPELQLGAPSACPANPLPTDPPCVPDFVRVTSYSSTANCADLAVVPFNLDIPIAAVHADRLELQPVSPAFNPDPACFASGDVGGTFEVHAGTTTAGAWMVLEDLDILGRVPHGVQFAATGPRFDYPLDYDLDTPPRPDDFAMVFSLTGPEPTVAGTIFDFRTADGQLVSAVRDLSAAGIAGFAGPILVYDTPRRLDQTVFTAITGSNSVLRAVPALFGVQNSDSLFFYY